MNKVLLNEAQQTKFQEINDNYGVAKWEPANEPGVILIVCDDGDRGILYPDGEFVWDFTG
jgi:hypothetical protein